MSSVYITFYFSTWESRDKFSCCLKLRAEIFFSLFSWVHWLTDWLIDWLTDGLTACNYWRPHRGTLLQIRNWRLVNLVGKRSWNIVLNWHVRSWRAISYVVLCYYSLISDYIHFCNAMGNLAPNKKGHFTWCTDSSLQLVQLKTGFVATLISVGIWWLMVIMQFYQFV